VIKTRINNKGYIILDLINNNGIKKTVLKHRIIALAFIKNDDPLNKIFINHIDLNKENFSINNLEWCTPSYNTTHAFNNGAFKDRIYQKEVILEICKELEISNINLKKIAIKIIDKYNLEVDPDTLVYTITNIKFRKIWHDITKNYNF